MQTSRLSWLRPFLFLAMTAVIAAKNSFSQTPSGAPPGTLTVIVTQFRNDAGFAVGALFDNAAYFPKSADKALKTVQTNISNHEAVLIFENLKPGEYAVSVFHDENKNKIMDTNWMGIPKEGVSASNNARGHMGPPKYKDAKFIFKGPTQTIRISMVYLWIFF